MMYWPPSQEMLYTIGVICVVCGTGRYQIRKQRRGFERSRAFAIEFQGRFHTYVNNPTQGLQTYAWLIGNSPQMQAEMGSFRKYENFTDGRFSYTNYPLILNLL